MTENTEDLTKLTQLPVSGDWIHYDNIISVYATTTAYPKGTLSCDVNVIMHDNITYAITCTNYQTAIVIRDEIAQKAIAARQQKLDRAAATTSYLFTHPQAPGWAVRPELIRMIASRLEHNTTGDKWSIVMQITPSSGNDTTLILGNAQSQDDATEIVRKLTEAINTRRPLASHL